MKLFTRKGIVTLGATVAIATTGIVAPAHAEEGTDSTEVTTSSTAAPTTSEKPLSKDEILENNQNAQNSSEFECGYYDEDGEYHKTTGKFANSLKCTWENGGPTERLGLITGFATLVTTVIGVASAVFNMAKKVAPDMF
ncbi:hypothetical protein [Corynebacterium frankenforstense]|uniref:hypothetical protein n=1 Tax=Corynebacterium frankenforstense TaxID=1230998 RepID=UPI0026EA24C2|nr:hypothetical protein [Corynebacterium frankenforstense]